MKIVKKNTMDCILFVFKDVTYLLPTVAFAELGVKGDIELFQDKPLVGLMSWRGFHLPVVAPDLSEENLDINKSNYAVLNALFANKSLVPYIGLVIDRHPLRLKVKPQDISWTDEEKKMALYTKEGSLPKEIVILDLQKLSDIVENATSHKSPYNP